MFRALYAFGFFLTGLVCWISVDDSPYPALLSFGSYVFFALSIGCGIHLFLKKPKRPSRK